MKLIWTYSHKLNRSKRISDDNMLKLFYHSIECAKKWSKTCVYTDSPNKFIGKVDEVIEIPPELDVYFLDDIKFYVINHIRDEQINLIDGDYFIDSPLEHTTTDIGIEHNIPHKRNIFYKKYNDVLEKEGVRDIIPYWKSDLGYYNLGLIQLNNFENEEFYSDYNKLKQFYKDKIEGIHFNKDEECVEMSLCTYFFTLFNIHKEHTFTILSKKGHTHLCGPTEKYKTEYIGGLSESKYLL